jgi:16S rRNA (guanine527-N7)-methyltransferase
MDILAAGARALGLDLTPAQLDLFARYQAILLDWNTRINLTAIAAPEDVQRKHFLDSLTCLAVLPPGPLRLIDVGSGAGFPGLPLILARPELSVVLLEATGKKAKFLEHVVAELGLAGVRIVNARAEEAGQDRVERERYDWAVARAVAPLPELAEYLLPLVRVGGFALAQKGRDAAAEAAGAARALKRLGGRLAEVRRVFVPGLEDERALIVVEKVTPTPKQYPRRPGEPRKNPLE